MYSDPKIKNLYIACVRSLSVLNKSMAKLIDDNKLADEDEALFQDRTTDLMEQVRFWTSQGNADRVVYELKSHILWIMETFSDDNEKSS